MADDNKKPAQKTRYRSVHGKIVPGSVVEKDGYVQATVKPQGPDTMETRVVRGYKERGQLIRDAEAKGGDVLFRGAQLGSKARDSVHLGVNSIDKPAPIKGRVVNVYHSGEGKQPAVNGFVINEIEARDGKTYKIGTPFQAFGDTAVALRDLSKDDVIEAAGREIVRVRETAEGRKFIDGMELMGPAKILGKSLEKDDTPATPDDVTPEDLNQDPFPPSDGDFDDEIPF